MAYIKNISSVKPDQAMNKEKGFTGMELRWLLSEHNAPVTMCTVGHTHKPKGGEHRAHHHTNADEVILMLQGRAIERIGDETIELKKGDCVFIPRGTIHAHKCISDEPVETYCIYVGAPSIEKTGYVLDEK